MADPTVIIDFEPDWGTPPEISYGFETALQSTPRFVEQRRPLQPAPVRSMNCEYVFSKEEIQRVRNVLLYGASKLCCVPIYSEPIQSAAITLGATSIVASTDITYFWNIKNCSYAVILDFVSGQSEMVLVSSVSGQTISLSAAITKTWTAATTIIYPAFAGKIAGMKSVDITDRVGLVSASFNEMTVGEEATEEWVGLTEQVCFGSFAVVADLTLSYSPLRGTHEFTRGNNFVSVQYTNSTGGDGGVKTVAIVHTHDRFTSSLLYSAYLTRPTPSQAYTRTHINEYLSSWAICPHTGQLWVLWSFQYVNGSTTTGYENVIEIFSDSTAATKVSTSIETSSGWAGKNSYRYLFINDDLWVTGSWYVNGGYYTFLEKRDLTTGVTILGFNRLQIYKKDGSIWTYGATGLVTDGEFLFVQLDGSDLKFLPSAIVNNAGLGELFGPSYDIIWPAYSGNLASWAGWYPNNSASLYSIGYFRPFGERIFLPTVTGAYVISPKTDPPA